jgi:hypothetical protein
VSACNSYFYLWTKLITNQFGTAEQKIRRAARSNYFQIKRVMGDERGLSGAGAAQRQGRRFANGARLALDLLLLLPLERQKILLLSD